MELGRGWRALKRVPELYDLRDICSKKLTAKMSWLCLWHTSHVCILCLVMSTPHLHGVRRRRRRRRDGQRELSWGLPFALFALCLFLLVFCFLCTNHVTPLTLVGHHTCMKGICPPHLFFWGLGNTEHPSPSISHRCGISLSPSRTFRDPFSHALLCTNKPWGLQAAGNSTFDVKASELSLSLSVYPKNITTCVLPLYKRSHTEYYS